MGEFKAQILAVLIVLGVFGMLSTRYNQFFGDIWDKVENKVADVV